MERSSLLYSDDQGLLLLVLKRDGLPPKEWNVEIEYHLNKSPADIRDWIC